MEKCSCASHANNVAVVSPAVVGGYEPWQELFLLANAGKFVCFDCGGEVSRKDAGKNYDVVSGSTITMRLRMLGKL